LTSDNSEQSQLLSTGTISINCIIHESLSILSRHQHQKGTFTHMYNNCIGNVLTTVTMTRFTR